MKTSEKIFFEILKLRLVSMNEIISGEPVMIQFIESLILAQDKRWRRA